MPRDGEGALEARYGTARRAGREVARTRPPGVDDDTVRALGRLSAAFETVEHARGHLYAFHRLSGSADRELQDAVEALRASGHDSLADDIDRTLVGRDVIDGRWTFQLVEEYDAGYWQVFQAAERHARASLGIDAVHLFEAEMKRAEQRPEDDETRT